MAARLEAGLALGAYVLEARLAMGGMAEIWSARHGGGERLALKILHPDLTQDAGFVAMFRDELRIAQAVNHPNLLRLRDAHEAEGHLFASMDLIEGQDVRRVLSQLIQRGERFAVPAAVAVVEHVACGLHHAHTLKDEEGTPLEIVHRDVSPHNIMIARDGVVRLLDFGIARAADRVARTRQGVVKGKASYMAPEQALGTTVGPRTDLFSLGIVLWEMLAMRRLFVADSEPETIEQVVQAKVPDIRSINPSVVRPLGELVHQLLCQNAQDRPSSAAEVQTRAQQILAEHFPAGAGSASVLQVLSDLDQRGAKPSRREDTEPTSLPIGDEETQSEEVSGSISMEVEAPTMATAVPDFESHLPTNDGEAATPSGGFDISDGFVSADSSDVTLSVGRIAPADGPSSKETPVPDSLTPDSLTPDSLTPSSSSLTPDSNGKVRRPTRAEILRAVEEQATVPVRVPDDLAAIAAAPKVTFEESRTVIDGEEEATEDIREKTDDVPKADDKGDRPTVAHAAPAGDSDLRDPASRPVPVTAPGRLVSADPSVLPEVDVGPPPPSRLKSGSPLVQIGLPFVTLSLAVVVLVLIFLLIRG